MDTTTPTPKPNPDQKPTGRGVRIALFVSLAINLLILGMVGGAVWDNRGKIGPRANLGPAVDAGMMPFAQAMDREQRREFMQEIGDHNRDLDNNRGRVREQMDTLIATISAQPFDPEALKAAFADAQASLTERQQIGADVLINRIAAMSDDERAEFVKRFRKSLRGIRPPGGRG